MIVAKTELLHIPAACGDCPLEKCHLPCALDGRKIRKDYLLKRHPFCPLIEVNEKYEVKQQEQSQKKGK